MNIPKIPETHWRLPWCSPHKCADEACGSGKVWSSKYYGHLQECDDSFIERNKDAVVWFLENADEIRETLEG